MPPQGAQGGVHPQDGMQQQPMGQPGQQEQQGQIPLQQPQQQMIGQGSVDPLTASRGARGTTTNYPTKDGGFVTTTSGTTADVSRVHKQQAREMENQIFTPLMNALFDYTAGGTGTNITPSIRVTRDISAYKDGDLKAGNRLVNYLLARNISFENSAVRVAIAQIPGGIQVVDELQGKSIPESDALSIVRDRIPPEIWKVFNARLKKTLLRIQTVAASMHAREYQQKGEGKRPLSMQRKTKIILNPRTGTPVRVPVR